MAVSLLENRVSPLNNMFVFEIDLVFVGDADACRGNRPLVFLECVYVSY